MKVAFLTDSAHSFFASISRTDTLFIKTMKNKIKKHSFTLLSLLLDGGGTPLQYSAMALLLSCNKRFNVVY